MVVCPPPPRAPPPRAVIVEADARFEDEDEDEDEDEASIGEKERALAAACASLVSALRVLALICCGPPSTPYNVGDEVMSTAVFSKSRCFDDASMMVR